jgi:hypothetical protein
MVWHSYLLNPRCFFEDCVRYGKLDFYALGLPWGAVDEVIDPTSFEYNPGEHAQANFEKATGLPWNNLDDVPTKSISCPRCQVDIAVPYTSGSGFVNGSTTFKPGTGYADGDFTTVCAQCQAIVNHDALRVAKFCRDVQLLLSKDTPMPGTILESNGQPPARYMLSRRTAHPPNCYFPTSLLRVGLGKDILDKMTTKQYEVEAPTMEEIKRDIEEATTDKKLVRATKGHPGAVYIGEKVAIRRMMSRYWYNSSPFSLDLSSAVIRQGSFIDKMHSIDWLHSPALMSTMARCLVVYERFFEIMAKNPRKMAVPTLNCDLAWHTAQTMPKYYYAYSDHVCAKLIDHDDKIEETDLSNAFAWTSKEYQDRYGEAYSECTCWYCEATREMNTTSISRLFRTSNAVATDDIHNKNVTNDMSKAPHISAHNAVRTNDAKAVLKSRMHAAKLDKGYHEACARAKKKGRPPPKRDDYFYAYAWGYPMMYPMPIYVPYGVDPCISGGSAVYPADPCTVNTTSGSYGFCAAGTCGGMAASGGCGAGGGACGSAGACGGGGSGGCGGGGGGGCGGGGGGGGGGCGGGGGGG